MKTENEKVIEKLALQHFARMEQAMTLWTEFLDSTPEQLGGSIKSGIKIFERLRQKELRKIAKKTGLSLYDVIGMFGYRPIK